MGHRTVIDSMPDLDPSVPDTRRSPQARLDERFTLFADVPMPIVVHDATGSLLFANDLAAQLCGFPTADALLAWGHEDWLGRFELLDDDGRPLPANELPARRVLVGLEAPERLVGIRSHGNERWAWVSARRLRGSDPPIVISVMRDASTEAHARQRRMEGHRRQRVSHDNAQRVERQGPDHLVEQAAVVTDQIRARREMGAVTKALALSERRFRSLVETVAQMVWTTSADGSVRNDSPSWREFTGQTYEEWMGTGWLDAVHPDDRQRAQQAWRDAVSRVSKYELEYRVRRADGTFAHTIVRGTPVLNEQGELVEWIGLNLDISDRVRAEDALREHERKLRLALEAGRMGTWEHDLLENRVLLSPEIERIHGIPVGSFEGTFEAYQRDIHPDDRAMVLETMGREAREHNLLYRIVRPGGEVRWLETFGTLVRNESGQPVKLIGVCSDVTDRVEAQEAKSALRIQKMLEGIGDSFAVYDLDWTVVFANQASMAAGSLKPSDVIGKRLWDLVPDAIGTRFYTELERVRQTGQSTTFEEYYAPVQRWFEVHAYPVTEIGIAVYSRDVTARRREQALQERLGRYSELRVEVGAALSMHQGIKPMLEECCRSMLAKLPVDFAAIWLVDAPGSSLELHASASRLSDLSGSDVQIRVSELDMDIHQATANAYLTNALPSDPRVKAFEWAKRAGMLAMIGYPLVVNQRLLGLLAVLSREPLPEDLTVTLASIGDAISQGVERRRAELALEEHARDLARSNADLEQFAYVASHDLQEPLRMVTSYVQLLERRYKDRLDDDARDFIGFAVEGVTRMRRLIEDLLTYSRVGTRGREPAPVELASILATAQKNLESAIRESDTTIECDPLPRVIADEGQLVQLFQNLLGNAIKFRREDPPRIHVGVRRADDEWVLSVKDNGIGIDSQYFERIFVIFQRLNARERYPGTGIGLAIVKKIVERHSGRIWVESTPGQGSTVFFTLPIAPRAQRTAS